MWGSKATRGFAAYVIASVLAAPGCGTESGSAPPSAPAPSATPNRAGEQGASQATPAPTASVDLLHAVGTELAVSSAYQNRREQAERLVDGENRTTWNSRTGELAGSWIEVRLPVDAQVTGIALVPGFGRSAPTAEGRTDLFTGNHRVARIRVLREGIEVGIFPIDNSEPVLVTVPVVGGGGVWRIELTELVPGTRSDWREACIAELQILGHAPAMTPGQRLPRVAVGELPPAAQQMPIDLVAVERRLRHELAWWTSEWEAIESANRGRKENTGGPDPEELEDIIQMRTQAFRRIATFVGTVDPVTSDAMRLAAARSRRETVSEEVADVVTFERGFSAVLEQLNTSPARCLGARALARIRLIRVANGARLAAYFNEIDEAMGGYDGDQARSRRLDRDSEQLLDLADEWDGNSRGVATRLLRRDPPTDRTYGSADDWTALRTHLEAMNSNCQ